MQTKDLKEEELGPLKLIFNYEDVFRDGAGQRRGANPRGQGRMRLHPPRPPHYLI